MFFYKGKPLTTSNQTRYAQFNSLTVTGRILNAEVVNGRNGEFLSVTLISTATKDGADLSYTFRDSGALLELNRKGNFNTGREVTIIGHISNVSEVYTTESGEVRMRKRPQIDLVGVSVPTGGLGRKPADQAGQNNVRPAAGTVIRMNKPAVEEAPNYGEATPALADGTPAF